MEVNFAYARIFIAPVYSTVSEGEWIESERDATSFVFIAILVSDPVKIIEGDKKKKKKNIGAGENWRSVPIFELFSLPSKKKKKKEKKLMSECGEMGADVDGLKDSNLFSFRMLA